MRLKIYLESDQFRCTHREANDFFHKVVEEHDKSNNKKAPCHKCAQEREIDYILAMTSSIVLGPVVQSWVSLTLGSKQTS